MPNNHNAVSDLRQERNIRVARDARDPHIVRGPHSEYIPRNPHNVHDVGTKRGKLYMIPCPIGEGEVYDVLPACNREIMGSLNYFIVENVRSARRFLSKAAVGITIDSLQFVECNEHTSPQEISAMVEPLRRGESAGFISEAGVPGVADPGAEVAALCHAEGIEVIPLVGPSSILLALMASGQNGQSFAFKGYLPVKPPERNKKISALERKALAEGESQIFIETPYRNVSLFKQLIMQLDVRTRLTVACDLTGEHQFIRTLPVGVWRSAPEPDIHKRPTIFIIGR